MKKNKRSIIVYLAGKYSGDVEKNIATARKYAIEIWEAGYTCICPHLNTAHFEKDCKCTYTDYLWGDLEILQCSDILFLMPGWKESYGARFEKDMMVKRRIVPTVYSMDHLDKMCEEIFDGE